MNIIRKFFALFVVEKTQRPIIILFLLLHLQSERGHGQSYEEYHRLISSAEEFYFLKNNVDSALIYYQSCFESFDFVFARDAVNAFQIAYREKRPVNYFLKRAIEAGVTPSNIANIPALSGFAKDSLTASDIIREYDLYRSRYLDRINVDCLNSLYELGITDQITKAKKGHSETGSLFKLASAFGLPGEKNCGIEDLEIHKELGRGAIDFRSLRDSVSAQKGKNLRYYSLNSHSLIMHIPIVIMLHDYCTYKFYEQALQKAYLEGFIHPREIGCIYDNAFRGDGSTCLMVPNQGIFGLNCFVKPTNMETKKANQLRSKWGICSVETDQKKKELEKEGFKFIWDYW